MHLHPEVLKIQQEEILKYLRLQSKIAEAYICASEMSGFEFKEANSMYESANKSIKFIEEHGILEFLKNEEI